ncbi:MAG: CPBP family intramembrane metalloprotease [Actinobacteria bacterium]|nr:CPBP family intramembrane metalloprotease [Actinomycetota bacterium]
MSRHPGPGCPVRWGLGDAALVWLGGLVAATVAASISLALRDRSADLAPDAVDLVVGLVAQNLAILGGLVLVSRRRGLGSLRADFGLALHPRDWLWLPCGVLLQVVGSGLIELLDRVAGGLREQEAARVLDRADGPELVALILGVTLVVPLAEELLFRGLLLRSLARRFHAVTAVVASAATFAGAHLLDPATAPLLVPLALLGLVSGIRAVRTGELSQSLMLHGGFNLLSAVVLVSS